MSSAFSTASRDGLGPEELRLLATVAAETSNCVGLPSLVSRLVPVVSHLVEFDQLVLAMNGIDGRHWALVSSNQTPTEEPGWLELGDAPSPLRQCLTTGADALASRSGSQLMSPGDEPGAVPDFATFPSALCLPLHGATEGLGALGIFSARGAAYGPDQLHVLRIVAGFVEATARRLVLSEQLVRAEAELSRVERLGAAAVRFLASDVRIAQARVAAHVSALGAAGSPEASRRAMSDLNASTLALGDVLTVIEDTGRIEDGELVARPGPVPLTPFLRERLDARRARASHSRIHLSGRAEPERVVGLFDRELVGRALDVMLDNALAHTPSGGRIGLVARLTNRSLTLAVGDTGPRVPELDRDRLFTRYGRLEGDNEPARLSGTLGLYFCRLVADAHNGRLTVEDLPEAGSVFRLVLPR